MISWYYHLALAMPMSREDFCRRMFHGVYKEKSYIYISFQRDLHNFNRASSKYRYSYVEKDLNVDAKMDETVADQSSLTATAYIQVCGTTGGSNTSTTSQYDVIDNPWCNDQVHAYLSKRYSSQIVMIVEKLQDRRCTRNSTPVSSSTILSLHRSCYLLLQ